MTKQANGKAGSARKRRVTVRRKIEAVHRVIRGEPLERAARILEVNAADLGRWQETYNKGVLAALETPDDQPYVDKDEEIKRLRTELNELNTASDLLDKKIKRLEASDSFRHRNPRR
ncbi:transposase [Thioalkalivibrio sp. HK1]|uniref:transposase n=1 Tax=Thioalkalivibrio sp. HK1 TaxID=1469245 RepID=UPI000471C223|nr:transposase [Thioalkalivibrio sp. HK1]